MATLSKGMVQVWIFLERNGNHLLSFEDSLAALDFLEVNDIHLRRPLDISGDIAYAEIDMETTSLKEFYKWSEIIPGTQPMVEVWRPFLWMGLDSMDPASDPLGVNRFLGDIFLAPGGHTAYTIASGCLKNQHS